MTISAIVIDDEHIIAQDLAALIGKRPSWRVEKIFTDPRKALDFLKRSPPDVCFLDIEMPAVNGVDAARAIASTHPDIGIIFVTAYDQYAATAFRVQAIDYLLKPVSHKFLDEACSRAEAFVAAQSQEDHQDGVGAPILAVKSPRRIDYVALLDVIMARAAGNYVQLSCDHGEYLHRMTLSDFEDLAGPFGFIRTHRSYVVNRRCVRSAVTSAGVRALVLSADFEAPVSDAFRYNVTSILGGKA